MNFSTSRSIGGKTASNIELDTEIVKQMLTKFDGEQFWEGRGGK